MMMPVLLASLVLAEATLPQFSGLSPSQYASAKAAAKPLSSTGSPGGTADAFFSAALARRGHSGDLFYLQGCDLSDPKVEAAAINTALVELTPGWDAYQQAVQSGRIGKTSITLPTSGISTGDVEAAVQADQQARVALAAPMPDAEIGEAVLQLRFLSLCEVDRSTGEWLQTEAVRHFASETPDATAVADLILLALHMDHLPDLQAAYSDVYLRRRDALGLPLEPGLRLRDRSLINLGQPQRYATLILCEAGRPTFAGRVNLTEANRLRQEVGLPVEDLELRARSGYCG